MYIEYEQRKDELRISDTTETADVPALQTTEKIAPSVSSLRQITNSILTLADRVNGGYGNGQKFIHAEANEFTPFLVMKRPKTRPASITRA